MSGQAIDYEALAKKYGAVSSTPAQPQGQDYAALAKQFGAVDSKPAEVGPQIKAAPETGSKAWWKEKLYNAADAMLEALPAGGAMVGGMIGAAGGGAATLGPGSIPGGIGGAGIGGMAGETAQQLGRRAIFGTGPQTSGDAAKQIATQGAIQGAIQGATEGAAKFAPGALTAAAEKQYVRALAPTTQVNKTIAQKIAPEMMDRGITGDLKSIADRASANASAIKPELDAAYNATPVTATQGAGTKIIGDLQKLKSKYIVAGKVANPEAVNAINSIQDIVQQYGPDISPSSLRQLKSIFDDPVAQQGGYAGTDLTSKYSLKAKSAAANSIREVMSQANPDVAALNKEISFWLDVQRVAGKSALRQTGQQGGLLKTVAMPAAGAMATAAGFAAGGAQGGAEAAAITALSGLAAHVMRTPAWRTTSAVAKEQLATVIARGDVAGAAALVARISAAGGRAAMRPDQTPDQ